MGLKEDIHTLIASEEADLVAKVDALIDAQATAPAIDIAGSIVLLEQAVVVLQQAIAKLQGL